MIVEDSNILTFDTDDDFRVFVVNPEIIVKRGIDDIPYHTWDFSEAYKDAIINGLSFKILDPNSSIKYSKNITYKFVPKKIKNILC